jgi:Rrf2 family protein
LIRGGAFSVRLSKRTEYGLRAIAHLARSWPKGFVQSRDLSQQEGLPNKFLESILLTLRRGGFLESKVGSGGGYRLSRSPRTILIGDLIRRLDGRLSVKQEQRRADATLGALLVHLVNEKLTVTMDEALDRLTLEELVEQANRAGNFQQEMYYI